MNRGSRSRIRLLLLLALLLATRLLLRTPSREAHAPNPTPQASATPVASAAPSTEPPPAPVNNPTPGPAARPASAPTPVSAPHPSAPPATYTTGPPQPASSSTPEPGGKQLQQAVLPLELPLTGKVIVVDAGHGGTDPGACMLGVKEAVITLEVALKLQKELEKNGATVIMTRTDNKTDLELVDILTIEQNAHPDFFISVHVNASPRGESVSGIQTYFRRPASRMFAHTVHAVMLSRLGAADKQVHTAGFYVINYDLAPSVLLEIGYITNTADRRKLVSPQYQQDLAEAITAGVIRYLEKKRQLVRLRKIGNLLYQPLTPLTL